MAIFDAMLEFSDGQLLTGSAAASNVLDLQAADLELGAGTPMYLNVKVGTALTSAGSGATLTIALCNDADATIDGSSTIVFQTDAIAEAACTAGAYLVRMALPVNFDKDWGADSGQYLGVYYTVAGENFTAGTIDAWIDNGPQSGYNTQVTTSNI